MIGLGAARQHAGERLGLDPGRDGNLGFVEPRVHCSTETHHVVGRALGVLGLVRRSLCEIARDGEGTIDVDAPQRMLDDDAHAGRSQFAIVACGTGAAIVRDAGVLGRAFERETGAYDRERHAPIGTADTGSPFDELGLGTPDLGVDFSRPARGLAVWAILHEVGANGVRERIVRHNDCARRVADRVRNEPMLELLAVPELSNCCFRIRPPHWTDESRLDPLNDAVLHEMRARGRSVTS